MLLPGQRNLF